MVLSRKNRRWEELTKESLELADIAIEFELYNKLYNKTEGKSSKTIDLYNLSLRLFRRYLIESEQSTKLSNLGERQVREFILYLHEKKMWQDSPHISEQKQKLAAISIQTYIRGLRCPCAPVVPLTPQ